MLVLCRKLNQDILIPDLEIIIRVLEISGKRVRLGIDAPGSVKILRAEVPFDSSAGCGPFYNAAAEDIVSSASSPERPEQPDDHIPAE